MMRPKGLFFYADFSLKWRPAVIIRSALVKKDNITLVNNFQSKHTEKIKYLSDLTTICALFREGKYWHNYKEIFVILLRQTPCIFRAEEMVKSPAPWSSTVKHPKRVL